MSADQSDQLTEFGKLTQIVADTGDIESIRKFKPVDATTNPSLILAAVNGHKYDHLVDDAVKYGLSKTKDIDAALAIAMDKVFVNFGTEIAKIVPGYVSTETDARYSFDVKSLVDQAHRFIDLYKENGIGKERILVKISTTWEGIRAAEILEKEGIRCNLTLLFGMPQAIACAEANVTLISPFVGRITDWYKKATGTKDYPSEEDPGVKSVREIYKYYKTYGYNTIVMGASFRTKGQILALAGCDKLTIGPQFLEEMKNSHDAVKAALNSEEKTNLPKKHYDENSFRWDLNEDQMATEKLSDGIRLFAQAARDLEKMLKEKLQAASK